MTEPPGLIDRLSPSTLERLTRCGYSTFLSRTSGALSRRSSPPARLGTAAHEVVAWAVRELDRLSESSDLQTLVRSAWATALSRQVAESSQIEAERVFGDPAGWPYMGVTPERLIIEVERLIDELALVPSERRRSELERQGPPWLHGTIDLCVMGDRHDARIIEFKAGRVNANDVAPDGVYTRQVLLYAAMLRHDGITPTAAEIRPIGRPPIPIATEESAIIETVATARATLDTYNAAVASGEPITLATPSDETCRWCAHVFRCPALWAATSDVLNDFQVVGGEVDTVELSANGATSLVIDADEGTKIGRVLIAKLTGASTVGLEHLSTGQRVRVVGAREVAPGNETLIAEPGLTRCRTYEAHAM